RDATKPDAELRRDLLARSPRQLEEKRNRSGHRRTGQKRVRYSARRSHRHFREISARFQANEKELRHPACRPVQRAAQSEIRMARRSQDRQHALDETRARIAKLPLYSTRQGAPCRISARMEDH